jgi:apolipoprotein N-acyltransferase
VMTTPARYGRVWFNCRFDLVWMGARVVGFCLLVWVLKGARIWGREGDVGFSRWWGWCFGMVWAEELLGDA